MLGHLGPSGSCRDSGRPGKPHDSYLRRAHCSRGRGWGAAFPQPRLHSRPEAPEPAQMLARGL